MRFVQTMVGRALDARRLEEACRTGASQMVLDTALKIVVADRAEVAQTAGSWLAWYDSVFSEPAASADAWIAPRMEYAMSVATRLSEQAADEKALTASEFYDGHLDWSSFDLDLEVNLGAGGDKSFSAITETTVPAPVTFRGAPAARYWEFEDARIEYGLLPVGPTDLAQLLMIEYASSYGNDWFVVPLTLPVGSLTAVNSLVVTDSFGVRTLLRPIGDRALPQSHWRMFQLSYLRRAGKEAIAGAEPNLFFLPPALARSVESTAIEEVLFMRDEMANLAWAIERSIESPIEHPNPRTDSSRPDASRSRGDRAAERERGGGAVSARVNSATALDSAAPGATQGGSRQDRLAPEARRRAATRRLAESSPCARPGPESRRRVAPLRRRDSPRRHPRDPPLSDGPLDRRIDMGLGRASQAGWPR